MSNTASRIQLIERKKNTPLRTESEPIFPVCSPKPVPVSDNSSYIHSYRMIDPPYAYKPRPSK